METQMKETMTPLTEITKAYNAWQDADAKAKLKHATLEDTYYHLKSQNDNKELYSYETHAPMVFNKHKLLKIINETFHIKPQWWKMIFIYL